MPELPWKTYIEQGSFGFQYPAYLSEHNSLSPSAAVSLQSREKAIFMCVVRETRDTFRKLGYDTMNLSGYMDLVKLSRENKESWYLPIRERNAKVNGLHAVEMYCEPENAILTNGVSDSCSMKLLIIEGRKGFFQVCIWCRKSDYDLYTGEFDRIIRSFKEI